MEAGLAQAESSLTQAESSLAQAESSLAQVKSHLAQLRKSSLKKSPHPPPAPPRLPSPSIQPSEPDKPDWDQPQPHFYTTTPTELGQLLWLANTIFWLSQINRGPGPKLTWGLARHCYVILSTISGLAPWAERNWTVWQVRQQQKPSYNATLWEFASLHWVASSTFWLALITFGPEPRNTWKVCLHLYTFLLYFPVTARCANRNREVWQARQPQRQQRQQQNPYSYTTTLQEFASLLGVASSAILLTLIALEPEPRFTWKLFLHISIFLFSIHSAAKWAHRNCEVWLARRQRQQQQQRQQSPYSYYTTFWEFGTLLGAAYAAASVLRAITTRPGPRLSGRLGVSIHTLWSNFTPIATWAHRNWMVWEARGARYRQGEAAVPR